MRRKFNVTYDATDSGVSWEVSDYTKGVIPVAKGGSSDWHAAINDAAEAIQNRIDETTNPDKT